jgi:hypothetical protein
MIELVIGAIVVTAIVLFLVKDSKKAQENADAYVPSEDEQEHEVVEPSWSGSEIADAVEKVEESKNEIEERLSKIASPDKDKPFANLSSPDVSEVPTYAEVIAEDKSESVVTEKPAKKKRYYKPKKKAPVSEFPIVPETTDKPKRKPYKKRTPKKDE